MKLSFDIHCEEFTDNPSYRIFVNNNLVIERDFVVPEFEMGYYRFLGYYNLPNGENIVNIQGLTGNFTLGKMWVEDNEIPHDNGRFIL